MMKTVNLSNKEGMSKTVEMQGAPIASTPFNVVQLYFLEMFSFQMAKEDLLEIKRRVGIYYIEKLANPEQCLFTKDGKKNADTLFQQRENQPEDFDYCLKMEEQPATTGSKLHPLQLYLIELFLGDFAEKELLEIKKINGKYLRDKVDKETAAFWKKKGMNKEESAKSTKNLHLRRKTF